MICEKTAKRFCNEDISLIENYDKAINDKTQTWHCHHRLEISCGYSAIDLIKKDMYLYRPAEELIFLTPKEHCALHKNRFGHKHSEESCQKMSIAHKGKRCSADTIKKMSDSHKGKTYSHTQEARMKIRKAQIGLHYWNNGTINKRSKECPGKGFVRGQLRYKNTNPLEAVEE